MNKTKNSKNNSMNWRIFLIIMTGLSSFIAIWNSNVGQIATKIIYIPLIATLGFVLLVAIFWFVVLKTSIKATLLAMLTLALCFSFGHVLDLLVKHTPFGMSIGFLKLLVLYIILFSSLIVIILKLKRFPKNTVYFLNIFVTAYVLINLFPIIVYQVKIAQDKAPATETALFTDNNDQPDIYYIVLDAYARQDVLEDIIGYDNSKFLTSLKDRGFYLPDCALSNYDITEATIGSVLNYDYLQNLGVSESEIGMDNANNAKLIWNNKVWEYFKQKGYHFVTTKGFSSFNDIVNSDLYLNYAIDQGDKNDISQQRFINLYLNTTIFRVATEIILNNPEKFKHLPNWMIYSFNESTELNYLLYWYNQNNYVFSSLEKIPDLDGNFFIYAHINSPHPPYVYREDGSINYPAETTDEKIAYANTITHLNKKILEIVDHLIKNSNPKPLIILQADHSIHMLTSGLDKHKILSAYYLPGNLITPPYETITPVNNFRLIFKNYFNPTIELLPDMIYVKHLNDYQFIPASCEITP
jgi:hypothetical protein